MEVSSEKAKYWHGLIQDWRVSGQPKKEFAKSRGVSADAMSYWVTKFNKAGRPARKEQAFVPVTVANESSEDQTITVHLSNGLSLAFGPDVQSQVISSTSFPGISSTW